MKTKITIVALLLSTVAPAALAQEAGGPAPAPQGGHPRGEVRERAPHERPPPQVAPGAPHAPQAHQPPAAPQAQAHPERGGPQTVIPPRQEAQQHGEFNRRPGNWAERGGRPPPGPEVRSFGGERAGGDRFVGDGRRDHRPVDRDGRPAPPPGPEARSFGGDRFAGDRFAGDRGREHDHRFRPEWRPGAFPHTFHSQHRFHVRPYVRPPHFYSRVWLYGEYLPAGWFTPEYLIEDWWDFNLPAPPPDFDWVRVGYDALLINRYSGQIVQVVRELFW